MKKPINRQVEMEQRQYRARDVSKKYWEREREKRRAEIKQLIADAQEEAEDELWDGLPPSQKSMELAYSFLLELPQDIALPSEVGYEPSGRLGMAWYASDRSGITVGFDEEGVLSFGGIDGNDRTFSGEERQEFIDFFKT